MTGRIASLTVTAAVQFAFLPSVSYTVRVTFVLGISELSKVVWDASRFQIPASAALPPSISAPVMVPAQLPSRFTVWAWHTATGPTVETS
ncbi:MAG: hypothetical protein BWY09_03176 [Candidatus Hydrogenedentes bacterium ADurb.Bin179]|nr:MAG: hypothetical protein BWY09_03176 [Candidatus Hydrogenedentes bacterium ADurb.Bin179]